MMIREPVQAGRFYPAGEKECRAELQGLIPPADTLPALPKVLYGGIVPHAGWICSGAVAARTFAAIAARRSPATVVVFGAMHRPTRVEAAVFARGAWVSPLGEIAIDERLAERVLSASPLIRDEPYAHEEEHSIEVQVPLIQYVFPGAKLLPIIVFPGPRAGDAGRAAARAVRDSSADAVFVGSTDFTHYGPGYGFVSEGVGEAGLAFAKANDRRLIERILALDVEAIVPEAKANRSACGSGAIAACVAACVEAGATRALLLEHTSSADVLGRITRNATTDSVGYASIVFASD